MKAVDLFVDNAAVFASKGEMRKLVQGGGVSLNKEKLAAFDQVITTADLLDEKYLLRLRLFVKARLFTFVFGEFISHVFNKGF